MSGKGDSPRPLSVTDDEYAKRFEAIDWSEHRSLISDDTKEQVLQDIENRLADFDGADA